MAVVIIGTLDTKGAEVQFVRDLLREAGLATLVIDTGVLQPAHFPPDVPRDDVFAAAGTSWEALRQAGDRGKAIEAAARGDGMFGLGVSADTTIASAAMRTLPSGCRSCWSARSPAAKCGPTPL